MCAGWGALSGEPGRQTQACGCAEERCRCSTHWVACAALRRLQMASPQAASWPPGARHPQQGWASPSPVPQIPSQSSLTGPDRVPRALRGGAQWKHKSCSLEWPGGGVPCSHGGRASPLLSRPRSCPRCAHTVPCVPLSPAGTCQPPWAPALQARPASEPLAAASPGRRAVVPRCVPGAPDMEGAPSPGGRESTGASLSPGATVDGWGCSAR